MIDYLTGTIREVKEKGIILLVNGIGFALQVPNNQNLIKGKQAEFYTYLHWNQENGPSLYGFQEEIEKTVFLLIIDCPKIGPSIATNILSQIGAGQFIEIVNNQNEEALSNLNGIGPKKSEQIIVHLKHKVQKILSSGQLTITTQQNFVEWQNLRDVLTSLNYSKPEITKALQYLSEKHTGQNVPLDQLLRSALSYLSGNI